MAESTCQLLIVICNLNILWIRFQCIYKNSPPHIVCYPNSNNPVAEVFGWVQKTMWPCSHWPQHVKQLHLLTVAVQGNSMGTGGEGSWSYFCMHSAGWYRAGTAHPEVRSRLGSENDPGEGLTEQPLWLQASTSLVPTVGTDSKKAIYDPTPITYENSEPNGRVAGAWPSVSL